MGVDPLNVCVAVILVFLVVLITTILIDSMYNGIPKVFPRIICRILKHKYPPTKTLAEAFSDQTCLRCGHVEKYEWKSKR